MYFTLQALTAIQPPPLFSVQIRHKKGFLTSKAHLAPFSRLVQVSDIWLSANIALSTDETIASLSKLHMRQARAGVEELSSGLLLVVIYD